MWICARRPWCQGVACIQHPCAPKNQKCQKKISSSSELLTFKSPWLRPANLPLNWLEQQRDGVCQGINSLLKIDCTRQIGTQFQRNSIFGSHNFALPVISLHSDGLFRVIYFSSRREKKAKQVVCSFKIAATGRLESSQAVAGYLQTFGSCAPCKLYLFHVSTQPHWKHRGPSKSFTFTFWDEKWEKQVTSGQNDASVKSKEVKRFAAAGLRDVFTSKGLLCSSWQWYFWHSAWFLEVFLF